MSTKTGSPPDFGKSLPKASGLGNLTNIGALALQMNNSFCISSFKTGKVILMNFGNMPHFLVPEPKTFVEIFQRF